MAKFDPKFDLKGATKPLYAGVGATDLAVERVRDLVTVAQKRGQQRFAEAQDTVRGIDLEPKALRDQAVTRVNARVDALAKDAKARRASLEKRVAELQSEALSTVGGAYDDLVSRGEGLVTRIRRQESTRSTRSSAKTTTTKAKTTKTQATKATSSTAKQATGTAKKTAAQKGAPARSSAKATTTAAKQTASDAARAAGDAAAKVGD
jgi:hypothetical protein